MIYPKTNESFKNILDKICLNFKVKLHIRKKNSKNNYLNGNTINKHGHEVNDDFEKIINSNDMKYLKKTKEIPRTS